MSLPFDYDVFLSFAAKDAELARSVWQALSLGGLRVFWSTDTLKERVGRNWVAAIQESLIRSQHFVLLWTPASRGSVWVEEEYQAFYGQCYVKDRTGRRLVILPAGEPIESLPPFLRNLQATGSARELVSLLGGMSPEELRQENRNLRARVEELQTANARLSAELGDLQRAPAAEQAKLERALQEAQSEIESLREQVEHSPRAEPGVQRTPSESWAGGPSPAPEVTKEVLAGLSKMEVKAGSYGSFVERGSVQVWKALYQQHGERVVTCLQELLLEPQHDWQELTKTLLLLSCASKTTELRHLNPSILSAVGVFVQRPGYVGQTALSLVVGALASPRSKWEVLFPLLEAVPGEAVGRVLQELVPLTPVEERARTAQTAADMLMYSNNSAGVISHAAAALKALNSRQVLPQLRDQLQDAPVEKANILADLLAHFGDRSAAPAIRQAIDSWRHGTVSIRPLLQALHRLEGEAALGLLVEILATSQPSLQKELLAYVLPKSRNPEILATVSALAKNAADSELAKSAQKYLAALQPT
jgi:hypothetical protein